MPCWCCWRPGACGLPVYSVDWQPVLPQKRRWLSDTSNATVLDRVGHWRVTVDVCRTCSNCPWQYPCIAWLVRIVGVCRMRAVHRASALKCDRLACGLHGRPSGTVLAVRRLRCLWCCTSVNLNLGVRHPVLQLHGQLSFGHLSLLCAVGWFSSFTFTFN